MLKSQRHGKFLHVTNNSSQESMQIWPENSGKMLSKRGKIGPKSQLGKGRRAWAQNRAGRARPCYTLIQILKALLKSKMLCK